MSETDLLIRAAGRLADGVSPPPSAIAALDDLCRATRLAFDAAAVSVSRVVEGRGGVADGLRYEASDGEGASQIVGVHLPAGQGIAGFVAATGQALSVDRLADDPRFARQVAEATGYVPTALLVVPIADAGAEPIGVLSVLDRSPQAGGADPLALAGAFARLAAPWVVALDRAARPGALLLTALATALETDAGEPETDTTDAATALAAAVRVQAGLADEPDADLARQLALLAELAARAPDQRVRAERVLEDLLALTEPRRHR